MRKDRLAARNAISSSKRQAARPRTFRPRLEPLEDRRLLATFQVDDNFVDNPAQRRYNTIQEAVNAANSGDTIKVAAGIYAENVFVNKKLTIEAKNEPDDFDDVGDYNAIVDPVDNLAPGPGSPAVAFNLQADGIKIKGFRISEMDANVDPDGTVGIQTSSSFSGYEIKKNLIENHTIGIYLNTATGSSVKETTVEENFIRNNNRAGASAGSGIYSDQGARKVDIEDNLFRGQQNVDINFASATPTFAPLFLQTDIEIEENEFEDSSGIIFFHVSNSEIEDNEFERSLFNGIELGGGCTFIDIEDNELEDVGTLGFNGIFLHATGVSGGNTNVKIEDNEIENAGLSGIVIRDSSFNVIKDNKISGSIGFDLSDPTWGNGISLENADNNRVEDNELKNNARDGLRVDAASTGNLIKSNSAKGNAEHDYHDDSAGGGTAGTANTYQKNKGKTQNRPGLIS